MKALSTRFQFIGLQLIDVHRHLHCIFPGLHLCPLPQQIMVDAGQLYPDWTSWNFNRKLLNRPIEIEEECPVFVTADHTLYPEEGGNTRTTSYRFDPVKTRRRIQNDVANWQLYRVRAI